MDGAAQVVHHGRSAATRPLMPFAVPRRRWLRDGAPAVHQSRSAAVKRKGLFILRKRSSDATSGSLPLGERVRVRECELAPHPSSDIPSPPLSQQGEEDGRRPAKVAEPIAQNEPTAARTCALALRPSRRAQNEPTAARRPDPPFAGSCRRSYTADK